ncbi:MAG: hypothetical protein U0935_11890 [Pirellulales bacterium]
MNALNWIAGNRQSRPLSSHSAPVSQPRKLSFEQLECRSVPSSAMGAFESDEPLPLPVWAVDPTTAPDELPLSLRRSRQPALDAAAPLVPAADPQIPSADTPAERDAMIDEAMTELLADDSAWTLTWPAWTSHVLS